MRGKRVVLVQRAPGGLLGGLWEFPKSRQRSRLPKPPSNAARPGGADRRKARSWSWHSSALLTAVDHTYSHFSITVHAFLCRATVASRYPGMLWVPIHRLCEVSNGQGRSNDCHAPCEQHASGGRALDACARRLHHERPLCRGSNPDDRTTNTAPRLAGFAPACRHLSRAETSFCAGGCHGAHPTTTAPLPIGGGQTISQPYIVALMTGALALLGDERVLEVGTGSGYQAAILSHLAREVHTVELLPALSARAQPRGGQASSAQHPLSHWGWFHGLAGVRAVQRHHRHGRRTRAVPQPLLAQLADGGRLVIPLVASQGYQVLKLLRLERWAHRPSKCWRASRSCRCAASTAFGPSRVLPLGFSAVPP